MSLPQSFRQFVADRQLLETGARVVAAVSGGIDSMVLLHLLAAEGYEVTAAHVNYGLRGADSEADEALIRETCAEIGIPLRTQRVPLTGSVQVAAREARYRFFAEVAAEVGARAVATAHHRDDQAETLLLNLLRGAGPRGLAGMPVSRPICAGSGVRVVRPLLGVERGEIEAYALRQNLKWRPDQTNKTGVYQRNVVRHQILPLVAEHFGYGAVDRLAQTADLMRAYLESGAALSAEADFEAACEGSDERSLRLEVLRALPEVARLGVLLEALRRWAPDAPRSTATSREVDGLLSAQVGRKIQWADTTVWREREHLVFETNREEVLLHGGVEVVPGDCMTPFGRLTVERLDGVPDGFPASQYVEVVDADRLRWPLRLRTWRAGDVCQPLGMEGRKNVSDVLTDQRVPAHDRARQLVLESGEDILWVVGHRLCAVAPVRPETRHAVRLVWNPGARLASGDGGR